MFLPFPILIKTKIKTRRKVMVLGLFAIGFFITAIQIIRIQCVKDLSPSHPNNAPLLLWSIIEVNLGIMVACVPVFPPLFKQKRKGSSKGTSVSSAPLSPRGSGNCPCNMANIRRFTKARLPSEDETFDLGNNARYLARTDGCEVIPPGKSQIMRETDIVVVEQAAPTHTGYSRGMGHEDTQIADFECWATRTHVGFGDRYPSSDWFESRPG